MLKKVSTKFQLLVCNSFDFISQNKQVLLSCLVPGLGWPPCVCLVMFYERGSMGDADTAWYMVGGGAWAIRSRLGD